MPATCAFLKSAQCGGRFDSCGSEYGGRLLRVGRREGTGAQPFKSTAGKLPLMAHLPCLSLLGEVKLKGFGCASPYLVFHLSKNWRKYQSRENSY